MACRLFHASHRVAHRSNLAHQPHLAKQHRVGVDGHVGQAAGEGCDQAEVCGGLDQAHAASGRTDLIIEEATIGLDGELLKTEKIAG